MMKSIAQIILFFSLVAQAQNTRIYPNIPLQSLGVETYLNSSEDTLYIKASEGMLNKISVLKRRYPDETRRIESLGPKEDNSYAIPLNHYHIGVYTVEVHYEPHIYPFKMVRIKDIPLPITPGPNIRSFKAVYGVVSGFSGYTAVEKALTKERMDELISKFETDKITKCGHRNWLKVYAIYEDNTEGLYYTID